MEHCTKDLRCLRTVGRVELIKHFFQEGKTDSWFPFSDTTLPKAVKEPFRAHFLQLQGRVSSKALCLEKGIDPDDRASRRTQPKIINKSQLPFKVMANLGGGANGMVDKVMNILTSSECVRKRFDKSEAGPRDVRNFLKELYRLKDVSHRHCVDLVSCHHICLFCQDE